MLRLFSRIGFVTVGAGCCVVSLYYRPLPDDMTSIDGPDRGKTKFLSSESISDLDSLSQPLAMSRAVVTFVTSTLSRLFLSYGGDFKIIDVPAYKSFLGNVFFRENDVPLLTVSNHRSMLDDPVLISNLLPYLCSIQPKYLRWNVCAQEYCYNKKLGIAAHAYCGLGKVLPMWRGGGIDQKLLLDFARHCATGQWLHVFPEAGVWQLDELGGRLDERKHTIGKLKWGVGKIIAHSPKPPIVVPFYHTGMETVLPQDPKTKALLTSFPIPRHRVVVLFGENLQFDDLISAHESKHGRLWKYSSEPTTGQKRGAFHNKWDSTPQEKELYNKITKRIEDSLESLGRKCTTLTK